MINEPLRSARKAAKLSLEQLAEDIGISVSQMSRIETGKRIARVPELQRIAKRLNVPVSSLLPDASPQNVLDGGDRAEQRDNPQLQKQLMDDPAKTSVTSIPVRGVVAAGQWMEDETAFAQDGEFVPAAHDYPPERQMAYRVAGNSMDLAGIGDGFYVICIAARDLFSGDLVVVERHRAGTVERTCKEIVFADGRIELWSRSSDPKYSKPLIIPSSHGGAADDGTEVSVVGLVIWALQNVANRQFRRR